MGGILYYITDDPWPLFGLLAVVELLLIVAIKVRGQGQWLKAAIGVAILGVGLLVASHLIVSDREAVMNRVRSAARAIEDRDPAAFMENISSGYDHGGMTHDQLKVFMPLTMGVLELDSVYFISAEVKVVGGEGIADFVAIANGRMGGVDFAAHRSEWRIVCKREGESREWKITEIQALGGQGIPPGGLPGLGRKWIPGF